MRGGRQEWLQIFASVIFTMTVKRSRAVIGRMHTASSPFSLRMLETVTNCYGFSVFSLVLKQLYSLNIRSLLGSSYIFLSCG